MAKFFVLNSFEISKRNKSTIFLSFLVSLLEEDLSVRERGLKAEEISKGYLRWLRLRKEEDKGEWGLLGRMRRGEFGKEN